MYLRYLRTLLVSGVVILGIGITQRVDAQDRLGDGHGLDNSLQIGSGGVNQPQAPPGYLNANDVITGNVSGLGFFRDGVGYSAPGEFGDTLGSDDLFRFQARSLPTGSTLGRPTPLSVYRSTTNLGVGNSQRRDYSSVYNVSGYRPVDHGGVVVGSQTSGDITRSTLIRSSRLSEAGFDTGGPGSLGSSRTGRSSNRPYGASPLLGLRGYTADGGDTGSGLTTGDGRIGSPDGPSDPIDETDDENGVSDPGSRYRLDYSLRSTAPSLELGRQLLERVELQRVGDPRVLSGSRVDQIENTVFGSTDSGSTPRGQGVYHNLLQQIRDVRPDTLTGQPGGGVDPTDRPNNRLIPPRETPDPAQQPPTDVEPGVDTGVGVPPSRAPSGATGEPLLEAQSKRRTARGLKPDQSDAPSDKRTPGKVDQNPLDGLLDALDYDLPRISTLAGSRESAANELLRKAEDDLASGRYFKAENRYQQVVRITPDDPMGRVGLIHAQIGAAMFNTAGLNMRRLFELHPELIAARYEMRLLPPGERLVWVQKELEKVIETGATREVALLMAYLGYQIEDPETVLRGLDLAKQKNADDPLVPLLRRIWVEGKRSTPTK